MVQLKFCLKTFEVCLIFYVSVFKCSNLAILAIIAKMLHLNKTFEICSFLYVSVFKCSILKCYI